MQFNLTGHHCDITPALRSFTTKKIQRLTRYAENITHADIVLNVDKLAQTAEATLHIPGAEIHAHATSQDMYSAIDMLIDKLERQLIKHREKTIQNHRKSKDKNA